MIYKLPLVLIVGAALQASPIIYEVSLTTSPLLSSSAGPFAIDIQLTDGSGTNDGNNIVTLTDLQFGGGSASGSAALIGGATGRLASGVSITDSAFLNEFTQPFAPGTALSFLLSLSTNMDAGGTPDGFSFAILDSSGNPIPTLSTASLGISELLAADITGPGLVINTYATDPSVSPVAGGSPIDMGPPVLTAPSSVPESEYLPLAAILLLGLFATFQKHRLPSKVAARDLGSESASYFRRDGLGRLNRFFQAEDL